MPTYDGNAYTIVQDLRESLEEVSDALVQGSDTSGAHSNRWVTARVNEAQRLIYEALLRRIPGEFLESVSLTGVSSVFTLPWNFGRLVKFLDADGNKVHKGNVDDRPRTGESGSKRIYYRKGNTLVLTRSGVTDTYTLWFRKKPRDIHHGQTGTGAATSIKLDGGIEGKKIDDYYNGMYIENITQDWVDQIDDYVGSTRVATISETAADDDYYGLVSEIPEHFHHLISPRAHILCKSKSVVLDTPNRQELLDFQDMFLEALRAFAGQDEDVSESDIWNEEPGSGLGGVAIPGHTGLV